MSLARLLPFLLQWTKPAGGVEHEHLPCWPLSCLGHSLRRGACAERRGGSHGLNSSLRRQYLRCEDFLLHFGLRWAHARVSGAGGADGMGMDQAATRGHGLDRPAGGPSLLSARHRCPLAAKVLPVSRSVGTRMVHTANFAGIGKGRRPQATCQREECEPFGVIPNYVINYLIVLIFINRLPFPLAAAL